MKTCLLTTLIRIGFAILLIFILPENMLADSWAPPSDATYRSTNGAFEFFVEAPDWSRNQYDKGSRGTLRRKKGDAWEPVWERKLVNRVCPVRARVADSGRYVVTFDEHHSVGKDPVVIYGEGGRLIRHFTLGDLKLENDPNIIQSVSSYWWNERAIILFGPPAIPVTEAWRRTFEDSLFIRLHWGQVIAIDLASGQVRDNAWWAGRPANERRLLSEATEKHLDATWLRLAREYFRKENFDSNPNENGVTGLMLVRQLRLSEALPLLREIAATERFSHWSAPHSKFSPQMTVQSLAQKTIAEIELK